MEVVLLVDKEEDVVVAMVEGTPTQGYLEAHGANRQEAINNLREVVIKRIEELASIRFDEPEVREV